MNSKENLVEETPSSAVVEDIRSNDIDQTSSSSSSSSLASKPSPFIAPRNVSNGFTTESNQYANIPEDSELPPTPLDQPSNGLARVNSIEVSSPSPDSSNLHSPRWRRTPSYEQLEEIGMEDTPGSNFKHRSNSTDRLTSPTRLSYAASPSGKNSLTLSMAGSEVESVYGEFLILVRTCAKECVFV